jgi:PAS domain S-box-containing protein
VFLEVVGTDTGTDDVGVAEAQRQLFRQMVAGAALRTTLEGLTAAIETRAPGLMASVLLVQEGRLRHGAAPSLPDGYNRSADGIPIGEGFGSCGTAAHRGQPVIVHDIQTDPLWSTFKEIAARYGLGACWSTPIFAASGTGGVVGTFALYYGTARKPRPDELQLVDDFSHLASIAIEYSRLRDALHQASRRHGDLIEDLGAIVWEADADQFRFISVSREAEQRLGLCPEVGSNQRALWHSLIHPEDREITLRREGEALRRGGDYETEYRLVGSSGKPLWARSLVSVTGDPSEGGRRLRGIVLDISGQRQAEQEREALLEQLQRERCLLRAAFDQFPSGVCLVDADRQIVLFNRALAQMLNTRPSPGHTLDTYDDLACSFPDGRPYTAADWPVMRALIEGQHVQGSEMELVASDGGRRCLVAEANAVLDDTGGVIASVSSISDVTEEKREQALQRMVMDAGAILAGSRDAVTIARCVAGIAVRQVADWAAIFTSSEEGELRCVSLEHRDPARAVPVETLDRLVGQPGGAPFHVRSVVVTGQPELLAVVDKDAYERGAAQAELIRVVRSMGAESVIAVPLTSPNRVLGAMVLVAAGNPRFQASHMPAAQELARRVALSMENARLFDEAQRAVRHREEFLSIAAHELKTPLASVRLTVQTIAEHLLQPQLDRDFLQARTKAGDRFVSRLDRLMNELLDVAVLQLGRLRLQREEMDLAAVVQEAIGCFKDETFSKKIDVAFHTVGQPATGWWDPARLEQVATNLLSNALKYGRRLPIRMFVEADQETATLQVEDEGVGIAPEVLPRLFKPFERGVSPGHFGGLGLGLYITDQIVRAHGGIISVRSAPGKGSTFTVRLPRGRSS